jgi:hypothetical protein
MKHAMVALALAAAAVTAHDGPRPQSDGIDPWLGTFSIIAADPAFDPLCSSPDFQRVIRPA